MTTWKRMTGNEIRPLLRDSRLMVCFACRKGCRDRMPKTPLDARFPWKRGPLMRGMVSAVTRDGLRVKVEDGAGGSGWVDIDAVLFQIDEL